VNVQTRLQVLTSAGLGVLMVLGGRVYDLAGRRHVELRRDAERRRRRVDVLPARRAPIVDRRGRPLAIDHPVEDLGLLLPDLDPALQWVTPLARAFRLSRQQALALVREAQAAVRGLSEEEALETEVELGQVALLEADRAGRLLRRAEGVRTSVEPQGLRVFGAAALLAGRDATLEKLAALLVQPVADLRDQVDAAVDAIHAVEDRSERIARWKQPFVLVEEAPFEVVARVAERDFELPGVVIRTRFLRRYPHDTVAAHLAGALGLPTPAERERDAKLLLDGDRDALGFLLGERFQVDPDFRLRDEPYGRTGLERAFDDQLRGTPGVRVQVRDSRNRIRETLLEIPPRDGRELRLTLDVDLQLAVESALDRAVLEHGEPSAGGAAVVFDLQDGGILTLASSPRFDPNTKRRVDVWAALTEDPRKPLLNRAVLAYTPASTWKILSAFALTDPSNPEAVSPHWQTHCNGRLFSKGANKFKCDGIHYDTGLVKAIERSCNVFFFRGADVLGRPQGARKLNPEHALRALNAWTDRLGLGSPVARGISGERGGVIPTPGYKLRRAETQRRSVLKWARRVADARSSAQLDEALRHFDHASFWYGQRMQDLQIRPGDVRNALIGQGDVTATPLQVPLNPTVLGLVRQGMKRVVSSGTARKAGLPRDSAGKTGTGQRGKDQPYLAWYMGYYPASRPRIAFAVLVDRTHGHGGDVCAPVARELIKAYRQLEGTR
jgi:penicillin-binding protein 2